MRKSRHLLLAGFCAALIAAGGAGGLANRPAGAQGMAGQIPGIVATGFGNATATASSAEVQVIVGPDMYGMAPASSLTEMDIEPIIDAIVATGVDAADIELFNPATNSQFTGPGAPGSALLRFEIPEPTDEVLGDLAQALYEAATEARLGIQHIGVRYTAADCPALQEAAVDAAVADARSRAERLAASLGAELGALIQAVDSPFGSAEADSCADPTLTNFGYGPYGPGTAPAFDQTAPVQATVRAQVTLTFEMIGGGAATPVSG